MFTLPRISPKYRNKLTIVDNIRFDSIKEAERYKELKLLAKAKKIHNLTLQPEFIIQDAFIDFNGNKHRKITYIADFAYYENGYERKIVEDVKGYKTDVYELKKKLFLFRYSDVMFREV